MEILPTKGLFVKTFRKSDQSSTLMVRLHATVGEVKIFNLVDRFQRYSLHKRSKNTKKDFGDPITIPLKNKNHNRMEIRKSN